VVSDTQHNRVLLFRKPDGGDFSNGQQAEAVIGQPNFTDSGAGNALNRFNAPQGIATDPGDRLYVADSGNNRISAFASITQGETNPEARFTHSISTPLGVAVNLSSEVWVTDVTGGRMLRFPEFLTWQQTRPANSAVPSIPTVSSPIAIALDGSYNPVIAETINRVSMYYVRAKFSNAASYVTRGLTPGMLAYVFRDQGPDFAPGTEDLAQNLPLPDTLGDLQVRFNGSPAPIFQAFPGYVSFQVPWNAPSSGTADVELIRVSTGEVFAAATFQMRSADPALFTLDASGNGPLAALNQDNTVNSPTNPAPRGSVIQLFGTGIGPIDNAPPSGDVPSDLRPAQGLPFVAMNPGPGTLPESAIEYFGLVNWFPGVFQLNVRIPESVPPGSAVNVGFVWRDYLSTDGPTGRVTTTIAVQ
jgi:uncharacterized protein (TIGR03437 family)